MNTISAYTMVRILKHLSEARQQLASVTISNSAWSKIADARGNLAVVEMYLLEAAVSDVSVESQPALADGGT